MAFFAIHGRVGRPHHSPPRFTVSPAKDRLDQIARIREGDLAEVPFAVLLYALARARRTAAIQIERGPLNKEIFLEDGVPVDCRSNLVHETLSRFMVANGHLTEAAADEAFRESLARSTRFGDVLIERRLVTAEQLMKILQQNLAHKLLDGFSWRDGRLRVTAEVAPTDSPLKVNVPQLILIGVGRFATQQQIDSSVEPLIGTPLAVHPDPPLPIAGDKLSKAHSTLLQALRRKPLRIDELAAAVGLPYEALTRHLYALTLIELVVPANRIPKPARPAASEHEPQAPERPPSRPATTGPAEAARPKTSQALRSELMELALNHRRRDVFDLLGVDPERAATTAHTRFLEFAEKFAPWSFEPELADKARDVFLAGARAYAHLCEPERRAALAARRQRPQTPPVEETARGAFRTKTELLDPEVQYRSGMKLADAGSYERAVEQLEYAADLDPQNLLYQAELAFCRYCADPGAAAVQALSELGEVTRIDPMHGLALFYTGEILRRAGSFEEAEVFLRRSVKPMAPDRRPIESLRALTRERQSRQ